MCGAIFPRTPSFRVFTLVPTLLVDFDTGLDLGADLDFRLEFYLSIFVNVL